MANKHGTLIEWTHIPGYRGETWTPWGGCSKVSDGCKNCWALRQANRFKNHQAKYKGTVKDGNWTGLLNRASDEGFYKPLHWRLKRAIFPCSMSDFFHEGADAWRETAWHTIYDTRQHLYLILTKRPERIPGCLPSFGKKEWPWPHVCFGFTAENQEQLEKRWGYLPRAALYFISLEPLLGPIDFERAAVNVFGRNLAGEHRWRRYANWIITGGESGPGARPCHPAWIRNIRDQCQKAEVPYFFKQWGEWAPGRVSGLDTAGVQTSKHEITLLEPGVFMKRLGKKRAGRLLDGRTYDEFPNV